MKSEYRTDPIYLSHFMHHMFKYAQLTSDCIVLALIYIERLLATKKYILTPTNCRPIIMTSLLLPSKVWDDRGIWNIDCYEMFPDLGSLKAINSWERHFLDALDWQLIVHGDLYAKYYFLLLMNHPVRPLLPDATTKLSLDDGKDGPPLNKSASLGALQDPKVLARVRQKAKHGLTSSKSAPALEIKNIAVVETKAVVAETKVQEKQQQLQEQQQQQQEAKAAEENKSKTSPDSELKEKTTPESEMKAECKSARPVADVPTASKHVHDNPTAPTTSQATATVQ
jgi:hypothetical protein